MSVVVSVRDVHLSYSTKGGEVHALQGVNLTLNAGEVVCLRGSSGSGKSTLINVIAGLDKPQKGTVTVCGSEVTKLDSKAATDLRLHKVGLVFQENNLVAQFTAGENIELILGALREPNIRSEALRLLTLMDIPELIDRFPVDMSGGQRQRVGIARALSGNRPVLICDEPTGALDSQNSMMLFAKLQELARNQGVGVLIATHDELSTAYADRQLMIRDGKISDA